MKLEHQPPRDGYVLTVADVEGDPSVVKALTTMFEQRYSIRLVVEEGADDIEYFDLPENIHLHDVGDPGGKGADSISWIKRLTETKKRKNEGNVLSVDSNRGMNVLWIKTIQCEFLFKMLAAERLLEIFHSEKLDNFTPVQRAKFIEDNLPAEIQGYYSWLDQGQKGSLLAHLRAEQSAERLDENLSRLITFIDRSETKPARTQLTESSISVYAEKLRKHYFGEETSNATSSQLVRPPRGEETSEIDEQRKNALEVFAMRWMFNKTKGAQTDFDNTKKHIAKEQRCSVDEVTDAEVVAYYHRSISLNGHHYEYLLQTQAAVVKGGVLYIHGVPAPGGIEKMAQELGIETSDKNYRKLLEEINHALYQRKISYLNSKKILPNPQELTAMRLTEPTKKDATTLQPDPQFERPLPVEDVTKFVESGIRGIRAGHNPVPQPTLCSHYSESTGLFQQEQLDSQNYRGPGQDGGYFAESVYRDGEEQARNQFTLTNDGTPTLFRSLPIPQRDGSFKFGCRQEDYVNFSGYMKRTYSIDENRIVWNGDLNLYTVTLNSNEYWNSPSPGCLVGRYVWINQEAAYKVPLVVRHGGFARFEEGYFSPNLDSPWRVDGINDDGSLSLSQDHPNFSRSFVRCASSSQKEKAIFASEVLSTEEMPNPPSYAKELQASRTAAGEVYNRCINDLKIKDMQDCKRAVKSWKSTDIAKIVDNRELLKLLNAVEECAHVRHERGLFGCSPLFGGNEAYNTATWIHVLKMFQKQAEQNIISLGDEGKLNQLSEEDKKATIAIVSYKKAKRSWYLSHVQKRMNRVAELMEDKRSRVEARR